MIQCPHCRTHSIPAWRKIWTPPVASFECDACHQNAGISVWAYALNLALLSVVFFVNGRIESFPLQLALIGAGVVVTIIVFWVFPLARR